MSKKKIILVSCGSFNPPTIMHLRMFEVARDHLASLKHKVLGGVMSPVHDCYHPKPGLLSSVHRIAMARLALQDCPDVNVSTWETEQERWTRTRVVLDAYKREIEDFASGRSEEERPEWIPKELSREELAGARLYLLCGDDLLESFNVPGLWSPDDVEGIVRDHGLVVISREGGVNVEEMVDKSNVLYQNKDNIHHVRSDMGLDINSAKIRLAVRRNRSIRFLVAEDVVKYIKKHQLYSNEYNKSENGNHKHVTVILPATNPSSLTLALEQDTNCNNDHDSSNSFSPTSPYYLPMHRHFVTPPNSPAVARSKSSAKGSQCDLGSSLSKIPMIDNDEDALELLVGLMSIEKEADNNNDKGRRRKGEKISTNDKLIQQSSRAKSESALQIELTSMGVRITSERESFL